METVTNMRLWSELRENEGTPLDEFLETRESSLKYRGENVVSVDGYDVLIRNNVLYYVSERNGFNQSSIPLGVFVNDELIVNGDMSDNFNCNPEFLITDFSNASEKTISFLTLVMLMNPNMKIGDVLPKNVIDAAKALASGTIEVLESTEDKSVRFSDQLKKKLVNKTMAEKYRILSSECPEEGMTPLLYGEVWHRPAAFLCKYTNQYWLMSIDENSYFGVELPYKVTSIGKAFESLVPNEIRHIEHHRQGEWFYYAVDNKEVPEPKDCLFTGIDNSISLPVEHNESNRHVISGDFRIDKNGQIFASNFDLTHYEADYASETGQHSEHSDHSGRWFRFMCNTAVRSVSAGGVD